MATWLTHLRVANKIYDSFKLQDVSLFFVGCIAPDTDILPDQSHWCINGDKTTCDTDKFYKECIEDKLDRSDIAFYIGYYVHLLTDVLWHKQKITPLKQSGKDVIKSVKQTWKNIDYEFLTNNNEFRPIEALKKAADLEKKWFSYYTTDKVKTLTDHIINSTNVTGAFCIDFDAKNEIEQFINESAEIILTELCRREV